MEDIESGDRKQLRTTYFEIKRLYKEYFDMTNSIRKPIILDRKQADDIYTSLKNLIKDLEEKLNDKD